MFACVNISGSVQDVSDANKYIEEMIENSNGQSNGGGRQERKDNNQWESRKYDNSLVIEIDPHNVGMVIGRGGSKIKELQSKHNVDMRIGNCKSPHTLACNKTAK